MNPLFRRVFALLPFLFSLVFIGLLCSNVAAQQKASSTSQEKPLSLEAAPLRDREIAVVPFRYEPPGRPIITIQARLNNSEPLTFVVDTGSDFDLLLAPWVEKKLGLTPTGGAVIVQPGDRKIGHVVTGGRVNFVTQPDGRAISVDLNLVAVGDSFVTAESFGPDIAGVMGGYFLRNYLSRFDFEKKTITFFAVPIVPFQRAENRIILPANSIVLPLVRAGTRIGQMPQVIVRLSPEQSAAFIVDTGANGSRLPAVLTQGLLLAATGLSYAMKDVNGTHNGFMILSRQVTLGNTAVPLVPFVAVSGETSCALGLDFLTRFRMTIDPVRNQLLLEPRQNLPPFVIGNTGMRYAVKNGKAIIDKVVHHSLTQIGIKKGDQILAVDGQTIANMPTAQALFTIDGYAETWMDLTLQKPDGSQATVRVLRRSVYPGIIPNVQGVFLARQKDKSWRVLYVQPGSAGEKAGVKPEDEMVRLNGKSVQEMDLDAIEEVLSDTDTRPSLLQTMVLKHAGTGTEVSLPSK